MLSDYKSVIVLDLETTGLDHRTERILEIGAVRLECSEVVDTFETLVKPEVPIRHSSFNIHGISEDMVKDAPAINEVLPKILEFMGDRPFIAHNAIFDYSFLNAASKRLYEKRILNLRIDSLDIFKSVFPEEPSHGLSALLSRFNFNPEVKHRALSDAVCLAKVYPQLVALYEQQMAWQFSQLSNVPYLVERYLRLQRTSQMLHAEMGDLREVFKIYFQNGGKPLLTTTGELMVSSYRRNYEYNDAAVKSIIKAAGLENQAFKINIKALDRLVDNSDIDEDIRFALKEARVQMSETRLISFIKPAETVEVKAIIESEEENSTEESLLKAEVVITE